MSWAGFQLLDCFDVSNIGATDEIVSCFMLHKGAGSKKGCCHLVRRRFGDAISVVGVWTNARDGAVVAARLTIETARELGVNKNDSLSTTFFLVTASELESESVGHSQLKIAFTHCVYSALWNDCIAFCFHWKRPFRK